MAASHNKTKLLKNAKLSGWYPWPNKMIFSFPPPWRKVGHENAALTKDRTLDSLYIQPLLTILNAQNPKNAFTAGSTKPK